MSSVKKKKEEPVSIKSIQKTLWIGFFSPTNYLCEWKLLSQNIDDSNSWGEKKYLLTADEYG